MHVNKSSNGRILNEDANRISNNFMFPAPIRFYSPGHKRKSMRGKRAA